MKRRCNYSIIGEKLKAGPIVRHELRSMIAIVKEKTIKEVGPSDVENCLIWLDNHYGIVAENEKGTICYMNSVTYQTWELQAQQEIRQRGGKNG